MGRLKSTTQNVSQDNRWSSRDFNQEHAECRLDALPNEPAGSVSNCCLLLYSDLCRTGMREVHGDWTKHCRRVAVRSQRSVSLVSCLPNIRTGNDTHREAKQSLKLLCQQSEHTQLHFATDSQYEREKIIRYFGIWYQHTNKQTKAHSSGRNS